MAEFHANNASQGAMPSMTILMRVIVIVALVMVGSSVVRNVTEALQNAVHGGPSVVVAAATR
jgi:hypothetical protein